MTTLQSFSLDGIRTTGRTVADGAYGTVTEYEFRGLTCAGKNIHRLLYDHASLMERAKILQRFGEECKVLSQLRHPNIVQFLGVHAEEGSALPILVMEYLPTGNLAGYLDKHGSPHENVGYVILRDVSLGLRYLHEHTPPVIHRDLSANNVLLTTSLSAKISDLGVAKILDLSPSQHMSTMVPGTPCYMPPEALITPPNYTIKIDSYSFGVLILHLLCAEWPFPTDLFRRSVNKPGALLPVTEVNRREKYLKKIGADHPLSGLICQCLSNVPDERPDAVNILWQIDSATTRVHVQTETVTQQLESLRRENQSLSSEIELLRRENQLLEEDNATLGNENLTLHDDGQKNTRELQVLRGEIQDLRAEYEFLNVKFEGKKQDNVILITANERLHSEMCCLQRENCAFKECVQPASSGHSTAVPQVGEVL